MRADLPESIQLVDLKQKPIAPGEIKRFIERFGLTGLLNSEGKAAPAAVDSCRYRLGIGHDENSWRLWPGAVLGHRHLAILDLSAAGHQPMLSDDGETGIVFNAVLRRSREVDHVCSDRVATPRNRIASYETPLNTDHHPRR